jgi:hypothetical protein
MSATKRFHQVANDALVKISEHSPAGSKLALVIYTPGEPEQDIILRDEGLDDNEVISALRRRGFSIDGDNAYKRDLCDSIVGTMLFGARDSTPPPEGHWGKRFWDIAREEAASRDELISALEHVTDCLNKALTGGEVSAARAGSALLTAGGLLARAQR